MAQSKASKDSSSKSSKTSRADTKQKNTSKKADHYDDGNYNYLHYWSGRDYEHESERLAIGRFLKGRHFKHAVDIGGGYGRLCKFLAKYADTVTLAEPSKKQLAIAKDYLKDSPSIHQKQMQADKLAFKKGEVDLLTMVRVMHHLPDPSKEFSEIARVLSDDGYLILEVANYAHARNRIKHFIKGKKLPVDPVDIRSAENQKDEEVAFVNHNPQTVIRQLAHAGLRVERVLSVSNLRSPKLKKIIPRSVMIAVEGLLQPTLSKAYFGPSVFFLVKKVN